MPISSKAAAACALLAASYCFPAAADAVEDFYRGRQMQIVIGHEAGGGYDLYARLVSRFLVKHLPGEPRIVPQNMVGAGSRVAANWLYNVAPKDGSVLGVTAQTTPLDQALQRQGVMFDASKFNWIGNPIVDNQVFLAWHTSNIHSLEEARDKGGLICGGTGSSTNPSMLPKIINYVAGTKIRVVEGYQGGTNVFLAMERGEVNCIGSFSWSTAKATVSHHLRDNKFNILVQWGPSKDPEIAEYAKRDVPLMDQYARDDIDRGLIKMMSSGMAIGRPLYTPPGVPADRVVALRKAFDETMKDGEFLTEAKKAKAEIRPMSGVDLQKLVAEVVQSPDQAVAKMRDLLD